MRQMYLNKMLVTLSICSFLLCGCGKEEEVIEETVTPTPVPVETTIEVQIDPEVNIEEHKGDTDIHVEQSETIPEDAYVTSEEIETNKTVEERLFDITADDVEKMSDADVKSYLHNLYMYMSPEFTEEDLVWVQELTPEEIKQAKQMLIDGLNSED